MPNDDARLTDDQIAAEVEALIQEMKDKHIASEPLITQLKAIWAGPYPPVRAWKLIELMEPGQRRINLYHAINEQADKYQRDIPS